MNRKIKRFFSIVLVACMLFTIVQPHAAFWAEEDVLTSELITEDESSTDSNASIESGENSYFELLSETESSARSEEILEETENDNLSDVSVSSEDEEENAEQEVLLTSSDDETEEPENDNWELGLVFYDSSVDNGKTPLTEIDWDASDGSYKTGTPRVITVQINYKNTNAVTTYEPGDLKINVNGLLEGATTNGIYDSFSLEDFTVSWIIGANDESHTGYDWNYTASYVSSPYRVNGVYYPNVKNINSITFENANTIEEKSNFEGSIQIVYTITPISESPEQFFDDCTHIFSNTISAEIENVIKSNELEFDYTRTYIHPWKYAGYTVTKTASKISSYDGLGKNASDYIWVKYSFYHGTNFQGASYPYIYATSNTGIYKDCIPDGCVVYDTNSNLLEPDENGYYSVKADNYTGNNYSTSIYVGYPKSIYNDENGNLNITNEVELWGTYNNKTESEILATNSVNINLANFEFIYSGNLYRIDKKLYGTNNSYRSLRYQDIINGYSYNNVEWGINPTAYYTGNKMTLKIGDDLLYSTTLNGTEKVKDDEYYFNSIVFYPTYFIDGNRNKVQANKYDCELYLRYAGSDDYVLYDAFKNPSNTKQWNFLKNDNVVGFFFMIYDMENSVMPYGNSGNTTCYPITATTVFTKKDIPKSGTLYNFDYLQVYFKDNNGNLILQNEPGFDSYSNLITKEEIALYDQNTYGVYLQRDVATRAWSYYKINLEHSELLSRKQLSGNISQNAEDENFTGCFRIGVCAHGQEVDPNYMEQYDGSNAFYGFKIYDLLPDGMELASTEDEIARSFAIELYDKNHPYFYDLELNEISTTQLKNLTNVEVNVTENWNNTNRTKIEIIGKLKSPIYMKGSTNTYYQLFFFYYNFKISYESFLEYGSVYENTSYVHDLDDDHSGCNTDIFDLDEDGYITDKCSSATARATITSVISTHQDVTKYVKTDKSTYSTGTVESSYNSEYEYKLRVRTGQNDVTNLVIYDSIEEYAQDKNGNIVTAYGTKKHWNGEFLGVDTSYAESKGYVVKTYYSENVLAGNLYNDDGTLNSDWNEYDGTVTNKYEYEPQTINSPNWPSNYNNNMTEAKDFWEVSIPGAESLEINFDSTCKFESASYDYLRFYDKNGNNITNSVCGITAGKIGGSDIAGKTYVIPGDYVKITMRTDGSGAYKGFSADITPTNNKILETYYATDRSKVKALAFEYLDADGNAAVFPANSLTYVLIKMKSPADENITSLAYNGCRTQWQALDEYDRPVDFITGINSNIVKVSLPNSVEDKIINLNFKKIIDATDEDFEKLKLDKDTAYNFFIILTNQETGDAINGLLDSKEGFRVTNIPIGTYIIKEEEDIWFNFVSMELSEPIEGIDFQEVDGDYILRINATVESDAAIEIDVTNKPDEERFYDSKYDIKNLFNLTK